MFDKYMLMVNIFDPELNNEEPIGVRISSLDDFDRFCRYYVSDNLDIVSCELFVKC